MGIQSLTWNTDMLTGYYVICWHYETVKDIHHQFLQFTLFAVRCVRCVVIMKGQHSAVITHHLNVLKEENERRKSMELQNERRRSARRASLANLSQSQLPISSVYHRSNTINNPSYSIIPPQDTEHLHNDDHHQNDRTSRRGSMSKTSQTASMSLGSEFAPISDEVTSLYSRVRRSHALFQLGLDDNGCEVEDESRDKFCGVIPKCRKKNESVDPRLFDDPASMITESAGRRKSLTRRKANLKIYKARKDRFSKRYAKLVNHPIYKMISMLISIGALYIKDICYATLPASADSLVLDGVLSFVFFWLSLELILYSLSHSGYTGTFFFWLDLVGTASILMDIPWILIGIGLNGSIFLIVKGGRMGRAARGASSVRFIKLIKMVRMIKLFRIIQLFRKNKGEEPEDESNDDLLGDSSDSEIKPTKMGSLLADRVTQKVILGVLLSFLVMPMFDVGEVDTGAKTWIALEDMEYMFSNYHNATGQLLDSHAKDFDNSIARFRKYQIEPILYLTIGSNKEDGETGGYEDIPPYVEIPETPHDLRTEEWAQYWSESGQSSTILNIRSSVLEEAILNICLTTFMMSIFAGGSFIISVDAFMLVYPLEYLVIVLKRLSSVVVMVMQEEGHNDDGTIRQNELVTSVMQAMTDIFYSGKREKMFINSLQPPRETRTSVTRGRSVYANVPEESKSNVLAMAMMGQDKQPIESSTKIDIHVEQGPIGSIEKNA